MFLSWMAAAFFGLLSATASAVSGAEIPARTQDEPKADEGTPFGEIDHSAWDQILRDVVRDERIDYLAVRKARWPALEAYLERLAGVDLTKLPRKERLAFYLNLYNATMVHTIVQRLREGYSVSEKDWGVFKEDLVRLKSGRISLDHLENEIIRPELEDPRIHVALVCGAVSCPPILPRAYSPKDLDQVLERNMRRFLEDESRNTVDSENGRLALSQVFNWYAADFGGEDELIHYLAHYHPGIVDGQEITFKEYSWKLNLAPPKEGRWIVLAEEAPLAAVPSGERLTQASSGEIFEVLGSEGDWLRIRRPFSDEEAWIPDETAKPYSPR